MSWLSREQRAFLRRGGCIIWIGHPVQSRYKLVVMWRCVGG